MILGKHDDRVAVLLAELLAELQLHRWTCAYCVTINGISAGHCGVCKRARLSEVAIDAQGKEAPING